MLCIGCRKVEASGERGAGIPFSERYCNGCIVVRMVERKASGMDGIIEEVPARKYLAILFSREGLVPDPAGFQDRPVPSDRVSHYLVAEATPRGDGYGLRVVSPEEV